MPWRTISIEDVRLTPQEEQAMERIQAADGVLDAILTTVKGEFIGAIRAGGNPYTNDGTIPDAVRQAVINRTRWMWLIEFPQLKAYQTKERSDANESAEKLLERLADGKMKIEAPENPMTDSARNAVSRPRAGRSVNTTDFDKLSST